MAVIDVVDSSGNRISQVDLNDCIFNENVNNTVMHQVIVSQLSARRSGTASVKCRSEVKGSRRKLYRQKGTGRARKGDIKSPLLRGGGVVFGPNNRSYTKKVMKKVKKSAIKMALSIKLKNNKIKVIRDFCLTKIKTSLFVEILKKMNLSNLLIIVDKDDLFLKYSSRNVPGVKILNYRGLNVLDILKYSNVVILESSLNGIEGKLL